MFYGNSYYTEEEFWSIYSKEKYLQLRKKYHAEDAFPLIFEKVVKPLPKNRYAAIVVKIGVIAYLLLFLVLYCLYYMLF
jgi:hypothetical protein